MQPTLNPNLRDYWATTHLPDGYPVKFRPLYGGRMSSKSHDAAGVAIARANFVTQRFLCTRMFQNRIADSVYTLLKDKIEYFGLSANFKVYADAIEHKTNGSLFRFYGMARNIDEIKSFEGANVAWVEEAHNMTQEMFNILRPTVMRNPGAEMWLTFNPNLVTDFVWTNFVLSCPRGTLARKINYDENPFLTAEALADIESAFEEDPELARHVYLGEPLANDELSIIPMKWIAAAVDIHKFLGIEPSGSRRVGFDVADEGPDANAITKAHGFVIQGLHEWRDNDPNSAATEAWNQSLEYKADEIIFDNIGVGAGAKGELRNRVDEYAAGARVPPTITGFNAAAGVVDPDMEYSEGKTNRDMFYNQKAQAWWGFRDRCYNAWKARNGKEFDADKLVSFDSESIEPALLDKLKAELAQPRREYLNGKVRVEPKDKMKKRGVKSPNLADSAIMAFAPKEADILSIFY